MHARHDTPKVAVAVATRDRAGMLGELLDSLAEQTLADEEFEVVVVDDCSSDETPALLAERAGSERFSLRALRSDRSAGPAHARNLAWRASHAPLVAFTDDDCVATPGWLASLIAANEENPEAIVQGRTEARPDQVHRLSPFSRTQIVRGAGPAYETCNIAYPRALLEELGGFAEHVFPLPGGEDTDLAWRALEGGARAVYAQDAVVHHAVIQVGPLGMLRYARRWERTIPLYARHPQFRRAQLHHGIFWSHRHEHMLLCALAALFARRSPIIALALAAPYLRHLVGRRSGPLLAPYLVLHDTVELVSVLRGAVRNRVLVI